MVFDYLFLLAAGKATRMKEICKKRPKVLLPIYDVLALDLFLRYYAPMVDKKIFINTHDFHEEIKDACEKSSYKEKIVLLKEEILLDVGGAVMNLKKHLKDQGEEEGRVLLVNADQFYFFEEEKKEDHHGVALFSTKVPRSLKFNALKVDENNFLKEIIPSDLIKEKEHLTYTGVALLDLSHIDYKEGVSSFFKTVANYKEKDVFIFPPQEIKSFDFGTPLRYYQFLIHLLEAEESYFHEAIDKKKINKERQNYQAGEEEKVINLGGNIIKNTSKGYIVTYYSTHQVAEKEGFYFFDDFVEVFPSRDIES